MFTILNHENASEKIKSLVLELLHDPRLEVRQMASTVLGGLFHCKFISNEKTILDEFSSKLKGFNRKKAVKSESINPERLVELHAGALGLCAYVNAFPYDVPDNLPEVLVTLSEHLNDPQPIASTIRDTLSNFKRTHYDNWRDHKQKFTSNQLCILMDLLLSPSYYA